MRPQERGQRFRDEKPLQLVVGAPHEATRSEMGASGCASMIASATEASDSSAGALSERRQLVLGSAHQSNWRVSITVTSLMPPPV